MGSRRSGRYLKSFLEPVASLWSSMGPWGATATPFSPETIKFWHFQICTPLDLSMFFLKFEFLVRDMVIQMGSSWCGSDVPIAQRGLWGSISHQKYCKNLYKNFLYCKNSYMLRIYKSYICESKPASKPAFYGVPEVREVSRKLPGARGFVVAEYQPVASHGGPIDACLCVFCVLTPPAVLQRQ